MNKIPVKQTIVEAYRFTFGDLGKNIGLIWLPVLVMTIGSYFFLMPYFSGLTELDSSEELIQLGPQVLRMYAYELAAVLFVAMIGVSLVREVLTPKEGTSYFRFALGGAELRVFGGYIGLFALMMVFAIALVLLGIAAGVAANFLAHGADLKTNTFAAMGLIVLIGAPVLIYVFVRLGFLMVPAAVNEGKFGIESSWRLTKGNFWRIFVITLATMLPVIAVTLIAEVAILGPDYFNPHLSDLQDKAAMARHSAEQMRLMSARFPMLMGLGLLLAPFTYALTFAPPAIAYRALTARTSNV